MNQEIHDHVTGYVLGELSDGESAAFRAHLESCPDCRAEVNSMREVAIELAFEQADEPPDHLRAKVLAAVAQTPQEAARFARVTTSRSRPRWIPVGIAAAVVVIALLGWSMLGTGRLINWVLNDPLAVTIEATARAGEFDAARVVFSESRNAAVLVVEGLDQLPAARIYELWLVDGDEVVPAGLFNTGPQGSARVLIEGEIRPEWSWPLPKSRPGASTLPPVRFCCRPLSTPEFAAI
ncbi:MAG: anti-sigma factor [Acidimicrobiia bacterium]